MVFFFQSRCGEYTIYMGKDKYENEDLINYGQPEDVWFHVDELSSAHVYLRMKPGMTLDDVSDDLILECSALVKANSIAGCKVRKKHIIRMFVPKRE
jgi:predicted ribosome quality control (RQC) complex YloA/Tae2 family protein